MAAKTFNLEVFKKDLLKASPGIENSVFTNSKRGFEVEKRITLGNFNNHPVTVELDEGPSAESKVLDYGNLYSLLGFEPGKDLTSPLYDILQKDIQIRKSNKKPRISGDLMLFTFQYTVPTLKDFNQVSETPPDWATRPWTAYIEEGIPYFAYYIFSEVGFPSNRGSRSGHGLQIKNKTNKPSKSNKIPYLRQIVNEFIIRVKERFIV